MSSLLFILEALPFNVPRVYAAAHLLPMMGIAKQPGDTQRQQMPGTRILAQTDMPAHARYHRRIKPSASSRPTWPSAAHSDRKERNVLFCAAS